VLRSALLLPSNTAAHKTQNDAKSSTAKRVLPPARHFKGNRIGDKFSTPDIMSKPINGQPHRGSTASIWQRLMGIKGKKVSNTEGISGRCGRGSNAGRQTPRSIPVVEAANQEFSPQMASDGHWCKKQM
jgi:hypothetical protein